MHAHNILRTALPHRSTSLVLRIAGHPAFATSPALLSRRYLSTNNGAPSLQSSQIGDKPGVEGLHQRMPRSSSHRPFLYSHDVRPCADDKKTVPTPEPSKQSHELLPAQPVLRGDWVLFHPVYTPEELKAVEVSGVLVSVFLSLARIAHKYPLPALIGHVP